jgi:hypothetical protein
MYAVAVHTKRSYKYHIYILLWQIRYTSIFVCEKTSRLRKVSEILKSNPDDLKLRRLCARRIASAFVKACFANPTSKWYKALSSALVDTLDIRCTLGSDIVTDVVSTLRIGIVVRATTSSNEADWNRLVGSDYEVATAITAAVLTYPDARGHELLDKMLSACPRARKPILEKVEEIVSSRYMEQHASFLLGLGELNIELFKPDEQRIVIRLISLMAQSTGLDDVQRRATKWQYGRLSECIKGAFNREIQLHVA